MSNSQPYNPQNSADFIRGDTRDTRRYLAAPRPSPPLKGLRESRAASVSYRASVPAGHGGRRMSPSYRVLAPGEEKWSVSFKALPSWGAISSTPPPFRHTPYRFWPRQATSVWRNLQQYPRKDGSYTFSAKEKDPETGLSYFGSRYYSSDLSIWLSVDPMAAKYPSLSPYTYCADNPVKLVDPNGDSIAPGSLSLWNEMCSSLNKEKIAAQVDMLIEKATNGVLCQGASNRYLAIDVTLTTMAAMEKSSQVYKLSRCKGAVSSIKYSKKDNSLTVNFSSTPGFIHEVTHCGQFEKGWVGFSRKNGLVFSDIYDELEAYRNQSWYEPSSLPFVAAINPLSEDWVRNIYDGKKFPYKNCGLFPTNRDSTMEDIKKAYPLLKWSFNGTISNTYDFLYFKQQSVNN